MRVLQLIDSLNAGGAERVAVNLANGLTHLIDKSYLAVTRKEGVLKSSISTKVDYQFLSKKRRVDFKVIFKLKKIIKDEQIDVIHAHSTSIYTAIMIKLVGVKVKLVWHDHYGESHFLNERPKWILKIGALFINYTFCVNDALVNWAKNILKIKKVSYLPNFVAQTRQHKTTFLKGKHNCRIVCLANLRPQKDHENLIYGFSMFHKKHQNYTLHLVGKDFNDEYSKKIKQLIVSLCLENTIFLYGSCRDTFEILKQANIAVLASKSEGLPLSLLEYGLVGLPVVCTNVGDCNKVITHLENGLLIPSQKPEELAKSLETLVTNFNLGLQLGASLKNRVNHNFSEKKILQIVVDTYSNL